jgi:hypothetical protein
MKNAPRGLQSILVTGTILVVVLLVVFSAYQYREKVKVNAQLRELIIRNDSIMSANIELTRALEEKERWEQKKKTALNYPKN